MKTRLISAARSFRRDSMTGREINSPRSNKRSHDGLIFFRQGAHSWCRQFCFDFTVRRAPARPFLYSVAYGRRCFYSRDIGTFTVYPPDSFYDQRWFLNGRKTLRLFQLPDVSLRVISVNQQMQFCSAVLPSSPFYVRLLRKTCESCSVKFIISIGTKVLNYWNKMSSPFRNI